MKIFPSRSAACFIATCFVVLSTSSFALPIKTHPSGPEGEEVEEEKQELTEQEARERGITALGNEGAVESRSQQLSRGELGGNSFPDPPDEGSLTDDQKILSRKNFSTYLACDIEKISEHLSTLKKLTLAEKPSKGVLVDRSKMGTLPHQPSQLPRHDQCKISGLKSGKSKKVHFASDQNMSELYLPREKEFEDNAEERELEVRLFLKKMLETAKRLSAKYSSQNQIMGDEKKSFSFLRKRTEAFFPNNAELEADKLDGFWQEERMTNLEKDQRYYDEFIKKEEEALEFLDQGQIDEALYCHNIAIMLDHLSESFDKKDLSQQTIQQDGKSQANDFLQFHQRVIALSRLIKVPQEMKDMSDAEKESERFLLQLVQEIQGKLQLDIQVQQKENLSDFLSLAQQYRRGEFSQDPEEFYDIYKKLGKKTQTIKRNLFQRCQKALTSRFTALKKALLGIPFDKTALFENRISLNKRVTKLMGAYKNNVDDIHDLICSRIDKLRPQLEHVRTEDRSSLRRYPLEDFLLKSLGELREHIDSDTNKRFEEGQEWQKTFFAKKRLLLFEALEPFAREKISLFNKRKLVVELTTDQAQEWENLLQKLDQVAADKVPSLSRIAFRKLEVWNKENKSSYLESREKVLSQISVFPGIFSCQVLSGGFIALCAVALAYEWYVFHG